MNSCVFCSLEPSRLCFEGELVVAFWDSYAVSHGHCLLIPRRHVATWWEATPQERVALVEATETVKQLIERTHRPDGYNIGVNSGEAAGQTIHHLHMHVIPRYRGDVPDPRGGVRYVIPAKANYLDRRLEGAPHPRAIVSGGEDPFFPHLRSALERAVRVDLAVAFIQRSGWKRVEPHLRDVLSRGGTVRLLTGDYMGVTDPEALTEILFLAEEFEGLTVRVFETGPGTFHPKCYMVQQTGGGSLAFVGSSNLSEPALWHGIEWNYRATDPVGVKEVESAFESLFQRPETRPLSQDWVEEYDARRPTLQAREPLFVRPEVPEPPPLPHGVQAEALRALEFTRREGNRRGLVVMATGLGKTWLAAFDALGHPKRHPDSETFRRVLFVAHREEILTQARRTFQRVRPGVRTGYYKGDDRDAGADLLFASIQTIGKKAHLDRFPRDHFDYIVVDEFHHASARTYRRLLDHFEPKFLLGLTATPERTDGGDLLALCGENLVYRCDLAEGVRRDLLCPFDYFGVPDEVDYRNIPWRSNRFDPEELEAAVVTETRAANALEQHEKRGGSRTVAFCCSVRHARFMRDYFAKAGKRVAAVYSDTDSDPRASSLEKLASGELDVLFAVDMFNEGVDLPAIDTVMMLRPTESKILWLQQLGRGLRKSDDKDRLSVIDYIGNHRMFLLNLETLFDLSRSDREVSGVLDLLRDGPVDLNGCQVQYDLEAIEILQLLLRGTGPTALDKLLQFYQEFREAQGERPRAVEVFHGGFQPGASPDFGPGSARPKHGSWFGFVRDQGDFTQEEQVALDEASSFLLELETTHMTKSYKMVLLQALLESGAFPGDIGIEDLADAFGRVAARSSQLRSDISVQLEDRKALRALLIKNPIKAWTGGWGGTARSYFTYEKGQFRSRVPVSDKCVPSLVEMTRELVEWRLAEYLSRSSKGG